MAVNKSLDINSNIKILIAEGKEEYVIEFLLYYLEEEKSEFFNDCILVSSNLKQLNREYAMGRISRDEFQRDRTKILANLTFIIDEIQKEKKLAGLNNNSLAKYKRIEIKDSFYETHLTGEVTGNYKIGEFIDFGGFGTVYKATDLITRKEVAIKISNPLNVSDLYINDIINFGRKVIKMPPHPNILRVIQMGQAIIRNEKVIYHVMEYASRGNLKELIYAHGSADFFPDKLKIFEKICLALDFAHNVSFEGEFGNIEIGIVHGDIKPSNILVTDNLEPKLADFMLVDFYLIEKEDERIQNDLLQRNPSRIIGTLNYMAPEQQANGVINFKTDIYSMGILLFEMLTLSKPHFGIEMEDISEKLSYIGQPKQDVLAKIIFNCLQINPAKRFGAVKDILHELGKA
jgi:eukaryotic-like serine/threonine-protein kinase